MTVCCQCPRAQKANINSGGFLPTGKEAHAVPTPQSTHKSGEHTDTEKFVSREIISQQRTISKSSFRSALSQNVSTIGLNTIAVDLKQIPGFVEESIADKKTRSRKPRGIISSADLIHIGKAKDIHKRTSKNTTVTSKGEESAGNTSGDDGSPRSPVYDYNVKKRRNNRLDEFAIFTDHTPFTKREMEDLDMFPMADASSSMDEHKMDSNVRFVVSLYRAMNNWLNDPKSAEIDRGVLLHPQIADLLKTVNVYRLVREKKKTVTSSNTNGGAKGGTPVKKKGNSTAKNGPSTAAGKLLLAETDGTPKKSSAGKDQLRRTSTSSQDLKNSNEDLTPLFPSAASLTPVSRSLIATGAAVSGNPGPGAPEGLGASSATGAAGSATSGTSGGKDISRANSSPTTETSDSQMGLIGGSPSSSTKNVSPKANWLVKPPIGFDVKKSNVNDTRPPNPDNTTAEGDSDHYDDTGDKMAASEYLKLSSANHLRSNFTKRVSISTDVKEFTATWAHPTNRVWKGIFSQVLVKNVNAAQVEAMVYDPAMYTTIDRAACSSIVYENHNSYQMKYGEYPGLWPVAGRGAFAQTRRFRFSDNPSIRVVLSRTVTVPQSVLEEKTWKERVGARNHVLVNAISAYVIEQLPHSSSEKGNCRVTVISHVNPQGNVEKSHVVARAIERTTAFEVLALVKNLESIAHKYVQKYGELAES